MRLIARITTTYDTREDRLRLVVEDSEGRHLVLWLTQRLAGRIVSALVQRLEGISHQAHTPSLGPALQLLEQASADLQRRPAPPIAPGPRAEEHLLTRASLRNAGSSIALLFHWSENQDDCAALAFEPTRLRQWLRIFHRHYKGAGWPLEVWPAWFDESARLPSIEKTRLN